MKIYGFENGCMYVCVLEAQPSLSCPSTGKIELVCGLVFNLYEVFLVAVTPLLICVSPY